MVSLVVLIWLIDKYVLAPIKKQKEILKKTGQETHKAMEDVINDFNESSKD